MRKSAKISLLIAIPILLLVLAVFLAANKLVPLNPENAYFLPLNERVSGTQWNMALFQPVFIRQYKRDGGFYFQVVYRDRDYKLRFLDVFAGGKIGDREFPVIFFKKDGDIREFADIDDVDFGFKFGKQIAFRYFIDYQPASQQVYDEICELKVKECGCATADTVNQGKIPIMVKQLNKGENQPGLDELISLSQAAELSGLTQPHLALLVRQGKLWGKKLGRNWVTTEQAVHDYLARDRRPGPKPTDKT